jgi:hypothetical protein
VLVGDLFCPLVVHVDGGIFGQLATRATGHLGFGFFYSKALFMAWWLNIAYRRVEPPCSPPEKKIARPPPPPR